MLKRAQRKLMLCFCFNRGDQVSDVGSVRRNSDESRQPEDFFQALKQNTTQTT